MTLVAGYGGTFRPRRRHGNTSTVCRCAEANGSRRRYSLQVLVVVAGHFLLAWMLLVAALPVAIAASVVTAAIDAVATTATTAAVVATPGV